LTLAAGSLTASSVAVPVRQTVLANNPDANGFPAPTVTGGTGVGFATLTLSTQVIATAANGFGSSGQVDVVGQSSALSWTGLTTNGTMYLYVDVASGALTAGSGTLAPTYQWGGTYSVTNGQFTFNIQAMSGQVGNGATAAQTNRVYVGEVLVAANVVSTITWYALMGRYRSAKTATLPGVSTSTTFAHNLGINADAIDRDPIGWAECTTTDSGFTARSGSVPGSIVKLAPYTSGTGIPMQAAFKSSRNAAILTGGNTSTGWVINASAGTGAQAAMTAASWSYWLTLDRGW
jgi:hypothetical protein